jgi:hypothetical protein
MDDERLKNPDGRPDYFDELLSRIRDIRASEKRFYQKVRDLFAVTGKTAAELIVVRADAQKIRSHLSAKTFKFGRTEKECFAKGICRRIKI